MAIVADLKERDPSSLLGVQRRLKSIWGEHEDKSKVKSFPVPVVVVGTKYDVFANTYESKLKKVLCDAMRYLAHTTGSDLCFASVREQ
jgi:dynein light intermediate chain 2